MTKIIRLTESDLQRIVKKVISEQRPSSPSPRRTTPPTNSTTFPINIKYFQMSDDGTVYEGEIHFVITRAQETPFGMEFFGTSPGRKGETHIIDIDCGQEKYLRQYRQVTFRPNKKSSTYNSKMKSFRAKLTPQAIEILIRATNCQKYVSSGQQGSNQA